MKCAHCQIPAHEVSHTNTVLRCPRIVFFSFSLSLSYLQPTNFLQLSLVQNPTVTTNVPSCFCHQLNFCPCWWWWWWWWRYGCVRPVWLTKMLYVCPPFPTECRLSCSFCQKNVICMMVCLSSFFYISIWLMLLVQALAEEFVANFAPRRRLRWSG